jgi:hypothetical protein
LLTANDCLDVGTCLGSPVSLDYHKRAPFPFNGTINRMHVAYQTMSTAPPEPIDAERAAGRVEHASG